MLKSTCSRMWNAKPYHSQGNWTNYAAVNNPLAGDVNLDGSTGFADFQKLEVDLGQSGIWIGGDLNGDGTVDTTDYNIVNAHNGSTGGPIAPTHTRTSGAANVADSSAGTSTYAQYTYVGTSRIIKVTHPVTTNNLTLAYTLSRGAVGSYGGMDRFGRVIQQLWKDGTLSGFGYDVRVP